MDSVERIRLQQELRDKRDYEIIDLLASGKDNFTEGAYEEIRAEAYRRKLEIRRPSMSAVSNDDPAAQDGHVRESSDQDDSIVCFSCGHINPHGVNECEECGLFLKRSGFDPLAVALGQGRAYGQMAKPESGGAKPLVSIGKLVFGIMFLTCGVLYIILGVRGSVHIASIIFLCVVGGFFSALGFSMIRAALNVHDHTNRKLFDTENKQ